MNRKPSPDAMQCAVRQALYWAVDGAVGRNVYWDLHGAVAEAVHHARGDAA